MRTTRIRLIVGGLVALFVAYVCGRAAGILLGIGPYPTEIAAMAVVLIVTGRMLARRPRT